MAQIAFQLAASFALSRIAAGLVDGDSDSPLVDEKPISSSTRGAFVPIIQGARRVGPLIGWVSQPTIQVEQGGSGGKGGGIDGASDQRVYFGDAWHILGVGPGKKIRRIFGNGEKFNQGGIIDRDTTPSGSSFQVTGEDFEGTATVYWGESDQPANEFLSDEDRVGVLSSWPYFFYIQWTDCRLGGFAQWPAIEYEAEVEPFGTTSILTTTDPMIENFPGPIDGTTDSIMTVVNSAESGVATIKIDDDGTQAAKYSQGLIVRVSEQSNKETNRIYGLVSATYDANEIIFDSNQGLIAPIPVQDDLTDTEWVRDGNITSITKDTASGSPWPFDHDNDVSFVYAVENNDTARGFVVHDVQPPNEVLSDGLNRIVIWVNWPHLTGQGDVTVHIGWETFNGPNSPVDDHTHKVIVELSYTGGNSITQVNGAWATVEGPFGTQDRWARITVAYNGGNGEDPSTSSWDRRLLISGQRNSTVYYAVEDLDDWVFDRAGAPVFGITTLTISEPMVDIIPFLGLAAPWEEGKGSYRGTNPIHSLVQFLFSKHPHGCGKDVSLWDEVSLNTAAEFFRDVEPYRCSILAQQGELYKTIIANILMDLGMMWSWNAEIGKYCLEIIREPSGAIPNIPKEAILPPKAEQVSDQEVLMLDRIIFGFSDQGLSYRDNGIPASDHGISRQHGGGRRTDVVPLYSLADYLQAKSVTARRAQEVQAPPTSFRHSLAREARRLRPGLAITLDGFNPVQRILSQRWDTNTAKMEVVTLANTYGVTADEVTQIFAPDTGTQGPEDEVVSFFEVPAVLTADRHTVILALRIRKESDSEGAEYWISCDGLSYNRIGRNNHVSTGGVLTEPLPSTSRYVIEDGPRFTVQGPDLLRVTRSLANPDWRAGKQWGLVCQGTHFEVLYIREVVVIDETTAQLKGVIRSPLGVADTHDIIAEPTEIFPSVTPLPIGQTMDSIRWTNQKRNGAKPTHDVGAQLFLFQLDEVFHLVDSGIQPSKPSYIKVRPIGNHTRSLSNIAPTTIIPFGKAYRPIQITGLKLVNLTKSYVTGTNVMIRWSIVRNFAKRERVGGGWMTGLETASAPLPLEGTFNLTIYDKTDVVVRTDVLEVPRFNYSNGDLISDLGSEQDFVVGVSYSRRGYTTEELKLYITKV